MEEILLWRRVELEEFRVDVCGYHIYEDILECSGQQSPS